MSGNEYYGTEDNSVEDQIASFTVCINTFSEVLSEVGKDIDGREQVKENLTSILKE